MGLSTSYHNNHLKHAVCTIIYKQKTKTRLSNGMETRWSNKQQFVAHITITFSIIDFQMFLLIVTHNKCRITTVTKAKTDIIISITAWQGRAVTMYVETFKIDVVVYIGNMCLTPYWLIISCITIRLLMMKI